MNRVAFGGGPVSGSNRFPELLDELATAARIERAPASNSALETQLVEDRIEDFPGRFAHRVKETARQRPRVLGKRMH